MKTRILTLTLLVAVTVALAPLAAQQAPKKPAAPATAAAGGTYVPAKLSDGQPDIQGHWGDILENIASLNVEPGKLLLEGGSPEFGALRAFDGFMVDPPKGRIPHQPWALARRNQAMKEFLAPSPAMMDPQTRGWPNGMPRENYYSSIENGPFQILQPPGYVVFFYEIHHEFRIVPLDKRPHPGKDIKLWEGDSRGHWEGNTLVIEVTNSNDSTRFDVMGNFHTDEMRVTERWTILDKNAIDYTATIDDPKVYTRPWTLGVKMVRAKPGTEIFEYAGVEGDTAAAELAPAIKKFNETKAK
ncbi:MAG: hypothetical protein ABL971_10850 [Vicinamibacterales bacterium]